MSRSVGLMLGEILDAVKPIQQYTQGMDYISFTNDTEKQDAVMRRLEIIGEAVKGLPDSLRNEHPGIS